MGQVKQKGIRRKLKINQEYAKQVDHYQDEEGLLEHAVERYSNVLSKYQGYLLNKTRYERFLEDKLKKTGSSLKGSATIEVFVPEDSEEEVEAEVKAEGNDGGEGVEPEVGT